MNLNSRVAIGAVVLLAETAGLAWALQPDDDSRATKSAASAAQPAQTLAPASSSPLGRADAGGRISVVTPTIRFGRRFDDEVVESHVSIANVGSGALQILDADAGCRCLSRGDLPPPLAPRASASLPIRLELRGYTGPMARSIRIRSDDPTTPVAVCTMSGEVVPRLELDPPTVRIQSPSPGAGAEARVAVRRNDGGSLDDLRVRAPDEHRVKASVERDGSSTRILIQVPMDMEQFTAGVLVETERSERVIHVSFFPCMDIRPDPEVANLGILRRGQVHSFRLVPRGAAPVDVREVTTSRADLRAELAEGSVVRYWLADDAPLGAFGGHVQVRLDGVTPPVVRVPVSAIVK